MDEQLRRCVTQGCVSKPCELPNKKTILGVKGAFESVVLSLDGFGLLCFKTLPRVTDITAVSFLSICSAVWRLFLAYCHYDVLQPVYYTD